MGEDAGRNRLRRIKCLSMAAILIFCMCAGYSSAKGSESDAQQETDYEAMSVTHGDGSSDKLTEPSYLDLRSTYALPVYGGAELDYEVDASLSLNEDERTVEFKVDVPEDALYEIWLTYSNNLSLTLASEMTLRIDDEVPFREIRRLQFEQSWIPASETAKDRYGNEIVTKPLPYDGYVEKGLNDASYYTSEPFLFQLTKGSHKLSLRLNDGEISIKGLKLKAKDQIPQYVSNASVGTAIDIVEGEDIAERNSASIRAGAEFNPDLTPYNSTKRVMNYLDGSSFKTGGQRVTYEVEAPEDGWYNITFLYRQNIKSDFPVFCNFEIDGHIPTQEAMNVKFPYSSSFKLHTAKTSSGDDQVFYLTKGKHTLGITISLDPLEPVYREIDSLFEEINDLTLEIMKLTGGITTDKYRDYNLKENIPNVQESLLEWADRIESVIEQMKPYTDNGRISAFSSMSVSAAQLRELAKEPEELPRRMNELSKGASSVNRFLAQQLQDINANNLSFDRIYIHQSGATLPKKAGVFYKMTESVKRFFISFGQQDYATKNTDKEKLQVWMARPRQYVELLQNMADTQFTAKTGIGVDISIMQDQSKLVLANASGKSPDLALSVQYVLPSYLAIREALYDLKEFDSFTEVAKRFPEGLFIPGIVEDGVYALPETMNFWVMFYRTDIFESLGIPIPNSMEDTLAILPELQRRNMNFFFPTAGMVGMKVFPGTMPVIWQSGGSIFYDDIGATALDSEISLMGFQRLTELFTIYNMPKDVPAPGFYQQFRDGTLPIGVSDLATYNLLQNAAPEIKGLWSIALFPGFTDDDGNVLRHTTGGAESDIMFKSTDKPEEAWKFLEWWSSTEVQGEYGNTLQSTYGQEYLWNTANYEAFSHLPLASEHKSVISEQMQWMTEAAWIPGTYMIERELSNAYNSVVVDGVGYRRAMDTAVKRIDREIFRKLEEFGYYKDGVMVRQYSTPDTRVIWED